jgi:aspartate/methionine/tyrosine aminotransferase
MSHEIPRMRAVQTPIIPVVAELIRAHPGTISLGQGVVSYGPPPQAMEEVARFWADPDNHKYKAVEGVAPLCDALARKLEAENGIRLGRDRALVVSAGGNMAFLNAVLAIADPGDEIVLLAPYYFNQHMAIAMAGCVPVVVDTDADYQPRLDAIRAAIGPRTRAVVTVSPNNPTGAVYAGETLRAINELCRAAGIYHVHDEAYEYFTYGEARAISPGAFPGSEAHTISLYSLSKAYGFASWRIGYMVIPAHLMLSVQKIQDTNLICPPVVSQHAACGALRAGRAWCGERLRAIAEVRAIVAERLAEVGDLAVVPPADGAFYFLIKLATEMAPMALVERLVREFGVAAIPGTAFGVERGCSLRISYGALEKATAAEGVGRLLRGLRALLG